MMDRQELERIISLAQSEPVIAIVQNLFVKSLSSGYKQFEVDPEKKSLNFIRGDGSRVLSRKVSSELYDGVIARLQALAHIDLQEERRKLGRIDVFIDTNPDRGEYAPMHDSEIQKMITIVRTEQTPKGRYLRATFSEL